MTLLAGALKLWVRSRCDRLGSLELTLPGSALTLMRGRLQGVALKARDVGFKGLPLQHVQLLSGPITVDVNVLSPEQMLALQHPFQVEGENFSEECPVCPWPPPLPLPRRGGELLRRRLCMTMTTTPFPFLGEKESI